jgi:hypothetical protein
MSMAKDTRSVIATAAKQGLGAEVEMLPVQADETVRKLDQLIKLMDDQVHLQRVGLLQDGHILRFNSSTGQRIALSLPDAIDDYVQRVILRTRNFYEAKLLATLQSETTASFLARFWALVACWPLNPRRTVMKRCVKTWL